MSESEKKYGSVAELLADPARWMKGQTAIDKHGIDIDPKHKEAIRWDLVGAVRKIYGGEPDCWKKHRAIREAGGGIGEGWVCEWNDDPNRTHEEVVTLLKKAGV